MLNTNNGGINGIPYLLKLILYFVNEFELYNKIGGSRRCSHAPTLSFIGRDASLAICQIIESLALLPMRGQEPMNIQVSTLTISRSNILSIPLIFPAVQFSIARMCSFKTDRRSYIF